MLCAKKYARLRARFFRNCFVAIAANIALLFFLGVAFGGTLNGVFLLGIFLLLATLELLVAFSTLPRFRSPPYMAFPDAVYPSLVLAWKERLARDGYQCGQIIYYADVTLHHRVLRTVNASIFPPHLFTHIPTLVVSESLLVDARDAYIVAFLEHEFAHLRSGTHALRTFGIVLTRPFRILLLCCASIRMLLERWNIQYVASPLYGFELYVQRVSSQSFEHEFELIADALAVQTTGNMHEYIEALMWITSLQEIDARLIIHNEHIFSHPTLETRIASLCHLCS